jgi:tetratricopeptide (TPR) repeat protein
LDEVYVDRICRRDSHGGIRSYAFTELGAAASNLVAISWFFDKPYVTPANTLSSFAHAFVVREASLALRAQGRLQEALPAMRASLLYWHNARIGMVNWRELSLHLAEIEDSALKSTTNLMSDLSKTELLVGDITAARATAERAIAFADRLDVWSERRFTRATLADTLHAAGEWEKAESLFGEAERQQADREPEFPQLYSRAGFQYCNFLLAKGDATAACDRAEQDLPEAHRTGALPDIALDYVTLGCARLALGLPSRASAPTAKPASAEARAAGVALEEAVERLRALGANDDLPRGLLARAAFRRSVGDWDGAARDLDEAQEIAEPGPMRLFLCDLALERQVALARREAFAPLNGLVDPSPRPPALPDAAEAARLLEEARNELDAARQLIADCGYHRRDAELADLDAVTGGESRFADLPPRV